MAKAKQVKKAKKVKNVPSKKVSNFDAKLMLMELSKKLSTSRAKKALAFFKTAFFLAIVALVAITVFSTLPVNSPVKPFVVTSGSMRPTIYEGSISFVVRSPASINTGDIITFVRPDNKSQNVTHRVAEKIVVDGKTIYKTKGDANHTEDSWEVNPRAIWGKVAFSIPLLGFVVEFAKTKAGVLLIVVLPLIFIALDEIRIIKGEAKKLRSKSKNKKTDTKSNAAKSLVIVLVFFTSMAWSNVATSLAAWTDTSSVSNGAVNTGWWVPPVMKLISPNSGQVLYQNNSYFINWSAASSSSLATLATVDLYYSLDGGATFTSIVAGTANDGSYLWTVPGIFSSNVVLRVAGTDSHGVFGYDDSDAILTIASPIVINEFLPDPVGADNAAMPGGEWVELRNNGNVPVDVAGWYIYDQDPSSITISTSNSDSNGDTADSGETVIQPSGYLVVYRNGDGDFELNNTGGDSVRLFDGPIATGNLIDSYTYSGDATEDKSIARLPDGTGDFVDPIPTPGTPNKLDGERPMKIPSPSNIYTSFEMSSNDSLVQDTKQESIPSPTPTPSTETVGETDITKSTDDLNVSIDSSASAELVSPTPSASPSPSLTPSPMPAATETSMPSPTSAPALNSPEPVFGPTSTPSPSPKARNNANNRGGKKGA